jgi:hypothetical protein
MSTRHSPDIEKIKAALTGAEGRRLDKQRTAKAGRSIRLRAPHSGATAKILQPLLGDHAAVQKFHDLQAKNDAKLAAALKKSKSYAVKRSAAGQKMLNAQAAERRKGLEALASKPLASGTVQYDWLNEPFLIWPTSEFPGQWPETPPPVLEASEIVPWNSFAKFQMSSGPGQENLFEGTDIVQFYYLWQNPNDTYAVINVDGYAAFNGYAYESVPGGDWPASRFAEITVWAILDILEWWNQPATQPPRQPGQDAIIADLTIDNTGWFTHGKVESLDILRGYELNFTQELVPPLGVLVIRVNTEVYMFTGGDEGGGDPSGYASMDFASGAFQVGSPAVVVSVLS